MPSFIQHNIVKIDRRFLNSIDFHKLLNSNFPDFSFVQIGANDGVSFDNLFEYLKKRGAFKKGIVVEPIQEYFAELQGNYSEFKNVACVNYALHPFLQEITLFKVDKTKIHLLPEWSKGIASILPSHHAKLGIPKEYILKEEVKCISFGQLMDKFSPATKHFNLLQVDTEGFDFEIIKMIDFKTMQFDVIKFEQVNLTDEDRAEAQKLLKSKNYTIINFTYDTIAVKKHIKISLK